MTCRECGGAGHIYIYPGADADPCRACDGTGREQAMSGIPLRAVENADPSLTQGRAVFVAEPVAICQTHIARPGPEDEAREAVIAAAGDVVRAYATGVREYEAQMALKDATRRLATLDAA